MHLVLRRANNAPRVVALGEGVGLGEGDDLGAVQRLAVMQLTLAC